MEISGETHVPIEAVTLAVLMAEVTSVERQADSEAKEAHSEGMAASMSMTSGTVKRAVSQLRELIALVASQPLPLARSLAHMHLREHVDWCAFS